MKKILSQTKVTEMLNRKTIIITGDLGSFGK